MNRTLLTEINKGRKIIDIYKDDRPFWFYLLRDKHNHLYIARSERGIIVECSRSTREDWVQ